MPPQRKTPLKLLVAVDFGGSSFQIESLYHYELSFDTRDHLLFHGMGDKHKCKEVCLEGDIGIRD